MLLVYASGNDSKILAMGGYDRLTTTGVSHGRRSGGAILRTVRLAIILVMVFLAGCSQETPPPLDATKEAGYRDAVEQLAALVRQADAAFANHKPDDAAALIKRAELLAKRVISVPHPTVEAAQAASDLDDLYGRMLLSNRHYGYARLLFQKNLARWKYWQPPTPDSARRLKQAQDAIAECDRHIAE